MSETQVKNGYFGKRLFDIIVATTLLIIFCPLIILCGILIKIESQGPILYWSTRIGRNDISFEMVKLRTMRMETPLVASDELNLEEYYITRVGKFIRRFSLDELPQLIHVLSGKMSMVGPRPALETQIDLIEARAFQNINRYAPGITGLAQTGGRDNLELKEKVKLDNEYTIKSSLCLDLLILCKTVAKVSVASDVHH